MRGASALNGILQRQTTARVRVFTVWLPILATDFGRPMTPVLGRLSDKRVQQYWDPDRMIAAELRKHARPPQPEPECCERSGVWWDLAAVYPPGAVWDDKMPLARILNGPVLDIASSIEDALRMGPQTSNRSVVIGANARVRAGGR